MCSQGHHSNEKLYWRFDVNHPSLHGPGTEARRVASLLHTDGSVLMPTQCPVGVGRFVKQNGPDWSRLLTKDRTRNCSDTPRGRQKPIKPLNMVEAFSSRRGSDRL